MDNKNILVSVYCLAYNHEKYIRECLDGFVNQKTNFKFEVIVHDDASTDGTADVIREYTEKYPDIIVPILQKENQYSKKINITHTYIVPKMRGKYVAVCEGDDYWSDMNKLQKQVDILEANPQYVACVHQTKVINCLKNREGLTSSIEKTGIIDKEIIFSKDAPVYHTSSLCYRKDLIESKPDFCFLCYGVDDYPLGLFLALQGPIYFINESMSVYRMYTTGSWSLGNKKNPIDVSYVNNMISILEAVDIYSNYQYHKYLTLPILEFHYKLWKANPKITILSDPYFKNLDTKRKIKMYFRIIGNLFKSKR